MYSTVHIVQYNNNNNKRLKRRNHIIISASSSIVGYRVLSPSPKSYTPFRSILSHSSRFSGLHNLSISSELHPQSRRQWQTYSSSSQDCSLSSFSKCLFIILYNAFTIFLISLVTYYSCTYKYIILIVQLLNNFLTC